MLEEYIVEGVNFVATVPVELELCESPHMEAATRAVERACHKTKDSNVQLLSSRHVNPNVGSKLFVWKNGDIGNDDKMVAVNFVDAARNAGLPSTYVRWLESI